MADQNDSATDDAQQNDGAQAATGDTSQVDGATDDSAAQAAANSDGGTDDAATSTAGDSSTDDGGSTDGLSVEEARKLRKENAQLRRQRNSAQKQIDDAAKADMDDKQRAEHERDAANEKVKAVTVKARTANLRAEVATHATALQYRDVDVARSLIDADQLEYDDDDVPTNVEKLLKDIAKKRPYLLGSGDGGDDDGNSAAMPGGNGRSKDGPAETDSQRMQRLFGGGNAIPDAAQAEQHGGGVVMPGGSAS